MIQDFEHIVFKQIKFRCITTELKVINTSHKMEKNSRQSRQQRQSATIMSKHRVPLNNKFQLKTVEHSKTNRL